MTPDSTAAAVFTRNAFCAAPVQLARSHLSKASPRYCLINAGNANAGTGPRGIHDATTTCRAVAASGDCSVEQVLPFSTGVIGEYLPVDAICSAIPSLHERLNDDGWLDCARAIMTTDSVPKGVSRRVVIGDTPVTVTGIAKGAGMIHPRMATLLAFLATDAAVSRPVLREILHNAVNISFNRVTVDGDTSTNDAVLLIATSKAAVPTALTREDQYVKELQKVINDVCLHLAQAVVRDGEGATKFITIRVEQGANDVECLKIADAMATSPLIKTAFHASDPNWGRILAAVGRAGIEDLDISKISVYLGDVCIVEGGSRSGGYTEQAGQVVMAREEIVIRVCLARGEASTTSWTCDLSHDYVTINAEYRT